jgi:hypothetical protein
MKYKKLAIGVLVILLASSMIGASAFTPSAGRLSPHANPDSADEVLDWEQANSNGFGDPGELEVSALEAFNGYLYAGTYNPIDPAPLYDGARIYRSSNGTTWTPVTLPGFGNTHDIATPAILDFVVFGSYLYAGTGRGNAAQVWRSLNGTTWAYMTITGFSDPNNVDINALAVYDGQIYAGVTNTVSGAKIYRSFTGDSNSWDQVTPPATTVAGAGVTAFAVFDGALWAVVESEDPVEIWRTYGGPWEVVVGNGFGDANTLLTGGMAEFGGNLYVGAGNTSTGPLLWHTDGMTWAPVTTPISDDPNNQQVEMVFVSGTYLYLSLKNTVTGLEVWRTTDGSTWEQVNLDGFSDSNNTTTNRSNSGATFLSRIYVGTSNIVMGGELWRPVSLAPTDIMLSNNSVDENQPVNTIVGGLTAASPDLAATFTFSLACAVAGADDGSFNISGTNLRTSAIFNRETKSTYNICIRVTDQNLLTFDKNFAITVNNVNEAPTGISLSSTTLNENLPANTVVGALTATDPDAAATFTFSLACAVAGADDASFNISGTNLRTSAAFNFEAKSTYSICVRVSDQGALTYDKNFAISVNNLNEAPTGISLSSIMVDENQPVNTVVGALTATDPDAGATFTFSLACAAPGVDDGSFNILGTSLRTSAIFDFAVKSIYNICIRVTDQGGLPFDKNYTIIVNKVGQAHTVIYMPVIVR